MPVPPVIISILLENMLFDLSNQFCLSRFDNVHFCVGTNGGTFLRRFNNTGGASFADGSLSKGVHDVVEQLRPHGKIKQVSQMLGMKTSKSWIVPKIPF